MTERVSDAAALASAMAPVPYRIVTREVESPDSVTLTLAPVGEALRSPQPGEFMMLYAFGVGEVAISVSGDPTVTDGSITHTVRAVGAVSRALHDAVPGTVVGVRGPFGTTWGLDKAVGRDLVMVAGGVGLCPLRPAVLGALARRASYGKITLIVGARSRADFVFAAQLEKWAEEPQIDLHLIVDAATPGWKGEVGLVTAPLVRVEMDADRTTAFLCGPEPMLRFGAEVLLARGLAAQKIRVSLERNMQCGIGWCGHCQLGPLLLCRDGPVVGYDVAGPLLRVKEL
ncbi:FAD/NAD(P)-binding protein [Mycobacterium intracellulare]|uniref:FAD/NAD(P)-binding protein n=2 Tax=Mycobacterium intracellulare subsp. chimaera TaxID=222805 RepID=A0ABT7NYZ6_MYCIT|nr:FAD/NAD(P)-binding protein [Mycobacterium intracellulare]ASQ86327.1 oxidoreductase [Mycobacterium intracellulare subsp. chimaera]MCF1811666.1 FAD/NAD(P)-binding protein [Mycobacterium intracellulare subsp. intracellulare]MDM3926257.1 FAD/NAD(P)-binding protein [Mycobacterium intracellulare subsp. chimaera]MDS0333223.1 FAD/NAD(P)-binding protein [Mycobacterium intracellulare]